MLHSRLMNYVDQVARLGSIRAAGARLHVAPSAINRQILMLEGELGEPIFDRLPRGMRLTPAGEVLVTHIRQTMQQYRETVTEMNSLKSLPQGEVVIAAMTGLVSSIVAVAAVRFHARHPEVRISIRTMSAREMLQAVATSEADLGLGFNIPESGQLSVCWQRDARLGAVVAAQHPLARLKSIPMELCANYPLVFADRSMVMHGIIADAFVNAGLDVEPAFHTTSIETMKRLASAGTAVAFLSQYDIADEQRSGRLAFRPISASTFSENVLSLVRRERHVHSLASKLFADEMMAALESGDRL
ncbi:LysR family transcriptional regulator [Saxibacter everestensis]|uniref:LysR family transcriptional regulator n=1 Tax=Saxibacter everestensis TaxID=2909229 RepID=A0ABY8QTF0_9MICO|nr:LysR family transcriptional regulator [Brevibacteriaceae bacterium ZFBP1038]